MSLLLPQQKYGLVVLILFLFIFITINATTVNLSIQQQQQQQEQEQNAISSSMQVLHSHPPTDTLVVDFEWVRPDKSTNDPYLPTETLSVRFLLNLEGIETVDDHIRFVLSDNVNNLRYFHSIPVPQDTIYPTSPDTYELIEYIFPSTIEQILSQNGGPHSILRFELQIQIALQSDPTHSTLYPYFIIPTTIEVKYIQWVIKKQCVNNLTEQSICLYDTDDELYQPELYLPGVYNWIDVRCRIYGYDLAQERVYTDGSYDSEQAEQCELFLGQIIWDEPCTYHPACNAMHSSCRQGQCYCRSPLTHGTNCNSYFTIKDFILTNNYFTQRIDNIDIGYTYQLSWKLINTSPSPFAISAVIIYQDDDGTNSMRFYSLSTEVPSTHTSYYITLFSQDGEFAQFVQDVDRVVGVYFVLSLADVHPLHPDYNWFVKTSVLPIWYHDWVVGDFSECEGPCTIGLRHRPLQCKRWNTHLGEFPTLLPQSFCEGTEIPESLYPDTTISCNLPTPENPCNGNGVCTPDGRHCDCDIKYYGADCSNHICSPCHPAGTESCPSGICKCKSGYSGEFCHFNDACDHTKCSGHGFVDAITPSSSAATSSLQTPTPNDNVDNNNNNNNSNTSLPEQMQGGTDQMCSNQCTCLGYWETLATTSTSEQCTHCGLIEKCIHRGTDEQIFDSSCSRCQCKVGFSGDTCACQLSYLTLSIWNPPDIFTPGDNSTFVANPINIPLQNEYLSTLASTIRTVWEIASKERTEKLLEEEKKTFGSGVRFHSKVPLPTYGDVSVESWFAELTTPDNENSYKVIHVIFGYAIGCFGIEDNDIYDQEIAVKKSKQHYPSTLSLSSLNQQTQQQNIQHNTQNINTSSTTATTTTMMTTSSYPKFSPLALVNPTLVPPLTDGRISDQTRAATFHAMRETIRIFSQPLNPFYSQIPQDTTRTPVTLLITPGTKYESSVYDTLCVNSPSLQCPQNKFDPFIQQATSQQQYHPKPPPLTTAINNSKMNSILVAVAIGTTIIIVLVLIAFVTYFCSDTLGESTPKRNTAPKETSVHSQPRPDNVVDSDNQQQQPQGQQQQQQQQLNPQQYQPQPQQDRKDSTTDTSQSKHEYRRDNTRQPSQPRNRSRSNKHNRQNIVTNVALSNDNIHDEMQSNPPNSLRTVGASRPTRRKRVNRSRPAVSTASDGLSPPVFGLMCNNSNQFSSIDTVSYQQFSNQTGLSQPLTPTNRTNDHLSYPSSYYSSGNESHSIDTNTNDANNSKDSLNHHQSHHLHHLHHHNNFHNNNNNHNNISSSLMENNCPDPRDDVSDLGDGNDIIPIRHIPNPQPLSGMLGIIDDQISDHNPSDLNYTATMDSGDDISTDDDISSDDISSDDISSDDISSDDDDISSDDDDFSSDDDDISSDLSSDISSDDSSDESDGF